MPKVARIKKHFCVWVNKDKTVCGMGFARSTELVHHIRTHTVEKPCICQHLNDNGEQCKMGFTRPDLLRIHIKTVHDKEKNYVCKHIFEDGSMKGKECGMRFVENRVLRKHVSAVHKKETNHICTHILKDEGMLCGKGCTSPANLQQHVMTNHTDKTSLEYLKYREKENQHQKERYAKNVQYKVSSLMRNSFNRFMKNHGGKTATTGRTEVLLGCTWEELVIHLWLFTSTTTLTDTPSTWKTWT